MTPRDRILKRVAVAQTLRRDRPSLHTTEPSPPHKKSGAGTAHRLDPLTARLNDNGVSVHHCAAISQLPSAVADALACVTNTPLKVRIAPHYVFQKCTWHNESRLQIAFGPWQPGDTTALSHGALAIADTGSLVVASGADNPTGLAFLPDVHIVAVASDTIVATLDDAMAAISSWTGDGKQTLPRAINIISGASRTADIASKIVHGAHGPRALCVVIYDPV